MIERTIEKISETEKKTEKDLEHLKKRWDLKLKAEKIMNIRKLKEYKRDLTKKMEIKKQERIHIIEKEIHKMEKETDRHLKDMENICAEKNKDMLDMVVKGLGGQKK